MTRLYFLLLLPLCGLACLADDWADFRGPSRNGHSPETGLLKKWPADGPKLLWSVTGIGQGYSSASIAKGKMYASGRVGGTGYVFCYDLSGKRLWKSSYGPETSGMTRFPGARSSPTINDGRVYVFSGLGKLTCLNATDGKLIWRVDLFATFRSRNLMWGVAESMLIDGPNLICTPGGPGATVVALNKKTGKTVWKCAGLSDQSAYCSPRLILRGETRLIVTMVRGGMVGIDADSGKLYWKHAWRNGYGIMPNTPVIYGDYLAVTAGYGKGGLCLKLAKDGKSVTEVWQNKVQDTQHGGLVQLDGYIYATSDKRPNGQWMCVDIRTGKEMYRARGIGKGCVVTAGGMLYCYGESGIVALAKATPKGFNVISSFEVNWGEKQHWAHPSISDGRLYIRHGSVMKVYDISAKGTRPSGTPKKKQKKVDFY